MKIQDSGGKVVFSVDVQKKECAFHDEGFKSEFEDGIWVPPWAQEEVTSLDSTDKTIVVKIPNKKDPDYQKHLGIFARAMKFYCEQELFKSGFKITN